MKQILLKKIVIEWANKQKIKFYGIRQDFVGPKGAGIRQENFSILLAGWGRDGIRQNHARWR